MQCCRTGRIWRWLSGYKLSKHHHRYSRACFCIRQGMVVLREIVPAPGGNCLKLVVLQLGKHYLGGSVGVVNLEPFPPHVVVLEQRFQAPLLEIAAMRHKRQPAKLLLHLIPHLRKYRGTVGVLLPDAVNPRGEEVVMVGKGLHQTVKRLHNLAVAHNHDANAANTRSLAVCRLEINGGEVGKVGKRHVSL